MNQKTYVNISKCLFGAHCTHTHHRQTQKVHDFYLTEENLSHFRFKYLQAMAVAAVVAAHGTLIPFDTTCNIILRSRASTIYMLSLIRLLSLFNSLFTEKCEYELCERDKTTDSTNIHADADSQTHTHSHKHIHFGTPE